MQEVTATIGGNVVRIYSRDTGPHGKIHGAYQEPQTGDWHIAGWQSTGYFHQPNEDGTQHKCAADLLQTAT